MLGDYYGHQGDNIYLSLVSTAAYKGAADLNPRDYGTGSAPPVANG